MDKREFLKVAASAALGAALPPVSSGAGGAPPAPAAHTIGELIAQGALNSKHSPAPAIGRLYLPAGAAMDLVEGDVIADLLKSGAASSPGEAAGMAGRLDAAAIEALRRVLADRRVLASPVHDAFVVRVEEGGQFDVGLRDGGPFLEMYRPLGSIEVDISSALGEGRP